MPNSSSQIGEQKGFVTTEIAFAPPPADNFPFTFHTTWEHGGLVRLLAK